LTTYYTTAISEAAKTAASRVELPALKCAGCRKCCVGDVIFLTPSDNPANFKTTTLDGRRVLKRDPKGNCVYLGKAGCQIYGRQPAMCRAYDCRRAALMIATLSKADQEERLATAPEEKHPVIEGRKRLKEIGICV
jgi:Fe-S-cluster containining protein